MASVTVDVDIDLDTFDDDEILEAAICIAKAAKDGGPLTTEIEELRAALKDESSEDSLPPKSTAASIRTMDDLRRWQQVEAHKSQ